MFRPFRSKSSKREIYFHEDDYCQQQLLPRVASDHCNTELRNLTEFANAHRDPDGFGWTAIYQTKEPPVGLGTLRLKLQDLSTSISLLLPPFGTVYTGYSSYRQRCNSTAAWGTSEHCALFANWNDEEIIQNIWTAFFEDDEQSIRAAAKAVGALSRLRQLVYVDWAWGYTCDAAEEDNFATMLRTKLETITDRLRKP